MEYVVGNKYMLQGGESYCGSCGTDLQEYVEYHTWTYTGKSGDMDKFVVDSPFTCPVCGKLTDTHLEKPKS